MLLSSLRLKSPIREPQSLLKHQLRNADFNRYPRGWSPGLLFPKSARVEPTTEKGTLGPLQPAKTTLIRDNERGEALQEGWNIRCEDNARARGAQGQQGFRLFLSLSYVILL